MYNDKVGDFLRDDSFIRYILEKSHEDSIQWEAHLSKNVRNKKYAEEAIAILQAPADVKTGFADSECEELKIRVLNTIKGLD